MAASFKKNLILALFIALLGAIIGGIIWLLLFIMELGIEFLWETLPEMVEIPAYTLLVCTFGGLLVGLLQKKYGAKPDELSDVMGEVKAGKRLAYDNLVGLSVCALVPLIFGGALGPEAGLTGVIGGLCFWLADRFKLAFEDVQDLDLAQFGMAAALGAIFRAPLFGFVDSVESEDGGAVIPKRSKMLLYFIAIFAGFGVYSLLGHYLGGGMGLGRLPHLEIGRNEWLMVLPLAVAGTVLGLTFYLWEKGVAKILAPLKGKTVLLAIIGGAVLGGVGSFLPFTMFAGETQMGELIESYQSFAPGLLLLTAFVKIFMINLCAGTGWRGGNIFPIIFSGVALGYALALLLPFVDPAFCVAAVTAATTAAIMRKPLAVTVLLMLCFPIDAIPPLLIGAVVGGALPLPKALTGTVSE